MKNHEILLDVIGDADESLIPGLRQAPKPHRGILRAAIGGICAAAVICGILLFPKGRQPAVQDSLPDASSVISGAPKGMLLAEAAYPVLPPYPDQTAYDNREDFSRDLETWLEANRALRAQPAGYRDGFDRFFLRSAEVFLDGCETENRIYSPLSLFTALGMTAEITNGNSRQQILDVLAQDDIGALRANAKAIWQANYTNDEAAKCILASSLWLNQEIRFRQDTVQSIADTYYASVFRGDPASDEYSRMMQEWISAQTDGLLDDMLPDLKMDTETVLSLAATVNYSGKWAGRFNPQKTAAGTFHAPGGERRCDFMHAEQSMHYIRGEHFLSVSLFLNSNGYMRLILPDEGFSPGSLLQSEAFTEFLCRDDTEAKQKFAIVSLAVPKFDVSSGIRLKEGMQALGITDVFDDMRADFSPLTGSTGGIILSSAEQDARVVIDEEGCKAAAVTVISAAATSMPSEQIDFVLDRPFIFEIMSASGMPLFVGAVNDPVQ